MSPLSPLSFDGTELVLRVADTVVRCIPDAGALITSFEVDGEEYLDFTEGLEGWRQRRWTACPLLYPWANRLDDREYVVATQRVDLSGIDLPVDANGLLIHGVDLSSASFQWVSSDPHGDAARCVAVLRPSDHLAREITRVYPFDHRMEIEVAVSDGRLDVVTSIHAGEREMPISFGWHPYFRLPGVVRSELVLELPELTHLVTDDRLIPDGGEESVLAGPLSLDGIELDDGYRFESERVVTMSSGDRSLRVELSDPGYDHLQLYAPLGSDFVCIEPMVAPTNGLRSGRGTYVPALGSFSAGFSVVVVPGSLR